MIQRNSLVPLNPGLQSANLGLSTITFEADTFVGKCVMVLLPGGRCRRRRRRCRSQGRHPPGAGAGGTPRPHPPPPESTAALPAPPCQTCHGKCSDLVWTKGKYAAEPGVNIRLLPRSKVASPAPQYRSCRRRADHVSDIQLSTYCAHICWAELQRSCDSLNQGQ